MFNYVCCHATDAKRLLGPRFNDRSDWPSDFEAKPATRVFWDVNEFPVPLDMPPKNVYEKIKTCLVANDCYTDDLTIWAYVKKQHLSDHLVREYKENGITFLDEGKFSFNTFSLSLFLLIKLTASIVDIYSFR